MATENASAETATTPPAATTETETAALTAPEVTATETEQVTTPEAPEPTQEVQLADDHPLVKTLSVQKEELKQLRPAAQKVQELETQVTELTAKATEAETIKAKYDRLESFLTSLGGPISKALDSRSFSTALFESDADVKELVAQWHKDNPSATSQALSSGGGATTSSKDMNSLLRSAAK